MIIYFVDGYLENVNHLYDSETKTIYKIDVRLNAYIGYSECIKILNHYLSKNNDTVIYTNFIDAIDPKYSFTDGKCTLYFYKVTMDDKNAYNYNIIRRLINAQDLTDRELKSTLCISKLYKNGEFN